MTTRTVSAQPKRPFLRVLKVDMRRAVCSRRFLLAVLMMLAWMVANSIHSVPEYAVALKSGAPKLFDNATTGYEYIGPVLLAIATVPYSFSYITEHESGFQRQVAERVGLRAYSISKVLSTALSAFLMAVVAMGLFLAGLCVLKLPHTVFAGSVPNQYLLLVATAGPVWYYAVVFIIRGLVCSLCAVFALMITGWLPNAYVGFLSPLIAYYFNECVLDLLWQLERALTPTPAINWYLISLRALFFDTVYQRGNLLFSFLWTVTFLATAAVLCGRAFVLRLGKGQDV